MLKSMRKHGITLALFAAGSTGLTAAINELTKSTIEEQASRQQKSLFDQVLPAELYNNDLLKSCYLASAPALGKGQHKIWIAKNNDIPVGAVMETTAPDGYSGAIQLLVAAILKAPSSAPESPSITKRRASGIKLSCVFLTGSPILPAKLFMDRATAAGRLRKTAAILTSLPVRPLRRARSSTRLSAPACTHKRCQRRFPNSPPVETRP